MTDEVDKPKFEIGGEEELLSIPKPQGSILDDPVYRHHAEVHDPALAAAWLELETCDFDLNPGLKMGPVSPCPDIRGRDHTATVEAMVDWFFANFENPAERTPYDEGEYIYIWGGPCDAREELKNAFGDAVTDRAIAAAVSRIENGETWAEGGEGGGTEWAPSGSRMREEEPTNNVAHTKRRLAEGLRAHAQGEEDAPAFDAHDIAELMLDHLRLSRELNRALLTIESPDSPLALKGGNND